MELIEQSIPAKEIKYGRQSGIVLEAGQRFRIDAPRGTDIIDVRVPDNKTWEVRVSVEIVET